MLIDHRFIAEDNQASIKYEFSSETPQLTPAVPVRGWVQMKRKLSDTSMTPELRRLNSQETFTS